MDFTQSVSSAVALLYNTYPFPPEPLLDAPPPGYNWRWHWPSAYSFCAGRLPQGRGVRILDAGCGTGVGTEYLVHLNPEAEVTGIDLSERAIATARERCRRSGAERAQFQQMSLYDADQLPQQYDWINCVGVLHHLPDPHRGIQALARQLAPGGIFHIFVYAAVGRWEIAQMQQAIALLQGERRGDYRDGVAVGRAIFASLPDDNRLKQREKTRWEMENSRDECFADMYVHPQEVDYTVDSLFELIDASGLEFVGFSNPAAWQVGRLLGGSPELMARAEQLEERDRYRLIERLDPEITHFEFFLVKPPFERETWTDAKLLTAIPERNPCMEGWPSRTLFDVNYQIVTLTEEEYNFIVACEAGNQTVGALLSTIPLTLEQVRSLQERQLVLLGF
ncbi:SAM-dependent methyltransferase [filamentous cyanobacterium CCP5]|nr:SAM-dependent methyltransferase [filamentous cyanobacterium CCP5]